jgi:hypothetical protein
MALEWVSVRLMMVLRLRVRQDRQTQWSMIMPNKQEKREDLGATSGILAAVSRELHRAIDQVWGGMFQMSVRMEKERQASARAVVEEKRSST